MNDAFVVTALSLVPKNPVARGMGGFARLRLPRSAHRALLRWYVAKYRVDLDECVGTLDDYPTLVDFFTRPLKPGVRPVDPDPDAIVSPVDARVYTTGLIENGRIPQAEGREFSVGELLGETSAFEGGAYAVLYLSPRDYHRVHTPCACRVTRFRYSPGRLWPVFPAATRRVPELFSRNERLTSFLDTTVGEVALVMVGAFGVGRMRVVYDDVVTNTGGEGVAREVDPPAQLAAAAELGRFEMGSTVILLFPPGRAELALQPEQVVRVGARIGRKIG